MSFLLFPLHGAIMVINLVALVVVVAALIDAAVRPPATFEAAGKQTKMFWILVFVLGLFVTLVGAVAAIVYFIDVRPALQIARGRGGNGPGRGSSSDGPYGPLNR